MIQHPRLLTPTLLILQFLVIVGVVWLKWGGNASYFMTPDSHYYLQAAHNLLKGKGYLIDFEGKETFCAIWPVGYACCIAGISWLTSFPLEIASKCVNLAAVGGCFWLIYRRFSERSWFVGLGLMSSSFVQLYTNTWSETGFIFFVLGFAFSFGRKNQIETSKPTSELWLLVWLIGAFLMRYAAVFLFIPLIWYKKRRVVLCYSLFVGIYLSYNFYHTDTFTGGHGFWPDEAFFSRIVRGFRGLGEEVLFFALRDWDLKTLASNTSLKWVIYGVAFLQLAIIGVALYKLFFIQKHKEHFSDKIILEIAFAYLFFIIIIYLTDVSIESLYFRRLAPFSLLTVVAGLGWVSSQKAVFEQTKWYFVVFFVLSLVHALPKSY